MTSRILFWSISLSNLLLVLSGEDVWNYVACNEVYQPKYCDMDSQNFLTVDEYERCAPARLPLLERNFFLGAAGRRITYKRNREAFDEIQIVPRMLRDVSKNSIETSTLGFCVDFPVGLAPVGFMKAAHPNADLATVAGISPFRTIMMLSCYALTSIEDVAKAAENTPIHLWLQVYIFHNRTLTAELVRRAENCGYKAIVLIADSPISAIVTCDARNKLVERQEYAWSENLGSTIQMYDTAASFQDIVWLRSLTNLPIIVKGLLSGADATWAVMAGASAILVSNHGGRQMDGAPAAIDALPGVVDALNKLTPPRDVYLDSGVRNGHDIYKAIARGAKMVFIGRPIAWGLALGGSKGVNHVMNILKKEFNDTMLLSGSSNVNEIRRDTLIPEVPAWEERRMQTHKLF